MNIEFLSDVLSMFAMASLLLAFVSFVAGTFLFYTVVRRLILDNGGRASAMGFAFFPLMLSNCLAARRLFINGGHRVPTILRVEIVILSLIIISFIVFLLAGFGSGILLESSS